jgi:hypothetical protein
MLDLLLLLALAAALFVVVLEAGKKLDDGLDGVRRRERAMKALEAMSQARHPVAHSVSGTDRCVSCGGPVLVENTQQGVCADCMSIGVDLTSLVVGDADWADLQRMLDEEDHEGEDHR